MFDVGISFGESSFPSLQSLTVSGFPNSISKSLGTWIGQSSTLTSLQWLCFSDSSSSDQLHEGLFQNTSLRELVFQDSSQERFNLIPPHVERVHFCRSNDFSHEIDEMIQVAKQRGNENIHSDQRMSSENNVFSF